MCVCVCDSVMALLWHMWCWLSCNAKYQYASFSFLFLIIQSSVFFSFQFSSLIWTFTTNIQDLIYFDRKIDRCFFFSTQQVNQISCKIETIITMFVWIYYNIFFFFFFVCSSRKLPTQINHLDKLARIEFQQTQHKIHKFRLHNQNVDDCVIFWVVEFQH